MGFARRFGMQNPAKPILKPRLQNGFRATIRDAKSSFRKRSLRLQSHFQNRTRQILRLGCPRNVGGQLELFLAGEMGEGGQLGTWEFSFRKYVFLKMSSRGFKMGFARRFGKQNHRFGRDLRFCKVIFEIEQGKFSGWDVPGTWVARWKFSWRGKWGKGASWDPGTFPSGNTFSSK